LVLVMVLMTVKWILILRDRHHSKRRGFEVKLNPGMTPGLIEKKEK
jgi:hypothetical protein